MSIVDSVAWSLGKATKLFVVHVVSSTSHKIVFWLQWSTTYREEQKNRTKEQVILHGDNLPLYSLCSFCWYFHKIVYDFISMKFLIAVFLPASPFILTSPFINFGDFCQPLRLLHPPRLLFWTKFVSMGVWKNPSMGKYGLERLRIQTLFTQCIVYDSLI